MSAEARRDLIRKLELEKKLERKVVNLNNKIVTNVMRTFASQGISYNASLLEDNFAEVLNAHYQRAADSFSNQLTKIMPKDIAVTVEETTLVDNALAIYFISRAAEQAKIITDTNQRNIDSAVKEARETRDINDKPLPQRDQAREAGMRTSRKLKGRAKQISTTETQNAAETAKATEAEVLTGRVASIVAGSPQRSSVNKEWVTAGDERVRSSHVAADSQVVDLSKPFNVGGQLLRWPGDTSLGASAENVINCRCASIIDGNAVFAERRKVGLAPIFETELTEQLQESVGL